MQTYLCNAFSLAMVKAFPANITVVETTAEEVSATEFISNIGHADSAELMSGLLGKTVAMNRISLQLADGDVLFICQYVGPRLPEGTTRLPDDVTFKWLKLTVQ